MELELPESHSEVFILTLTRSEKEILSRVAQEKNASMRTILRALIRKAGETSTPTQEDSKEEITS